MQKKSSLALAIVLTMSLSASALAATRDRDSGGHDRGPITRIVQVLKRLFGVHANDLPTMPIP
jgi:hypothetical protein